MRLTLSRGLLLGLLAPTVLVGGVLLAPTWGRHHSAAAAGAGADTVLKSMEAILQHQGLAAALDSLALRAARDSALLRDGHQMAHALGHEAVAAHGGDA